MILKRVQSGNLQRSISITSTAMVGPNPPSKSQWQKKPTLSHFLCLPLVTEISRPQLDRSLGQFKAEVCADGPGDLTTRDESGTSAAAQSLSAKAIRPLGTLHLTLGVMTLNQDQLAKAVELLRSLDVATLLQPSSVDSKSESESGQSQNTTAHALTIDLKGLESMHDPESTSILYVAPSDRTERLYAFCLALQRHFEEFIVSDDRPLKLHATIVNTIYAKSKNSASRSQGHGPKARGSSKIDATAVLRKYHDFVWAENFRLDRIAICEMGAKKIMDAAKVRVVEERYTEVASAALPS